MKALAFSVPDRPALWVQSVLHRWGAMAFPLSRAPFSQRGLALGAALAMALALTADSVSQGLWVGCLVGGGMALMGLPQALGWSEGVLKRVGTLALVYGLGAMFVLALVVTDGPDTRLQLRTAMAFTAVSAVVLPYAFARIWPQVVKLIGPLAVTGWATIVVFAGATLVVSGFTWPVESNTVAIGVPVSLPMILVIATWIAAFGANRYEATRNLRQAGRMLSLRHGLTRLGGLFFGWMVALQCIPWMEWTAAWAAFNTPLEGIAPWGGVVAGTMLALCAAAVFFALPGVLARFQLSGRCGVEHVGEASWGIALVSAVLPSALLTNLIFSLEALPSPTVFVEFHSLVEVRTVVMTAFLAALAHAMVRVFLVRPAGEPGTPLWLVLPGTASSPSVLSTAESAANAWSHGPVTWLAAPAVALRLMGPHLRLSRMASLPAPLMRTASDALAWQHALPDTDRRTSLPAREVYGSSQAALALLAKLSKDARVLVLLDGPLTKGWKDALASLPDHTLRLTSDERFVTPDADQRDQKKSTEGWRVCNFGDAKERQLLVDSFKSDSRPPAVGIRHLTIVHGETDRAIAKQLVLLLDGQTDAAGRSVNASATVPSDSAWEFLGMTPQGWQNAFAFNLRAIDRDDHPLRPAAWFLRALLGRASERVQNRLDLVVLEEGFRTAAVKRFSGPEKWADVVLSMRTPTGAPGSESLYEEAAYTAYIDLPPASAVSSVLPQVAQVILDDAFSAAPLTAPESVTAEKSPHVEEVTPLQGDTSNAAETLPERWRGASTRVYVSYSRRGREKHIAQQLRETLEKLLGRDDACISLDPTEGLKNMESPLPLLDEVLGTATHFVLLASNDYWTSAWCRRELENTVARYEAEGTPRLFCVFVDETPESINNQLLHHAFRCLGPFNVDRRLVTLSNRVEATVAEDIEPIAHRLSADILADSHNNDVAGPIVLNYVREYSEYGAMLARSLQRRGYEIETNVGLLDEEARLLYLSRMLVVLTGPALDQYNGYPIREADIALEFGMRVVPVKVAPAETTFALRRSVAANRRYLLELDPASLAAEIERTADTLVQIASAGQASRARETRGAIK